MAVEMIDEEGCFGILSLVEWKSFLLFSYNKNRNICNTFLMKEEEEEF
jgi:hypothetical protein